MSTISPGTGRAPTTAPGNYRTARDILAARGRQPVVIQRTEKRPGDLVLHSWAQKVEVLS